MLGGRGCGRGIPAADAGWRCAEICGDVRRCAEICGDVRRYAEICGDVRRYAEMCGDVRAMCGNARAQEIAATRRGGGREMKMRRPVRERGCAALERRQESARRSGVCGVCAWMRRPPATRRQQMLNAAPHRSTGAQHAHERRSGGAEERSLRMVRRRTPDASPVHAGLMPADASPRYGWRTPVHAMVGAGVPL
jgi:hypothetical protein